MSDRASKLSESRLDIRPVVEDELPSLEQHLHRGFPQRHRPRIALQSAGKATYLIAWLGDVPVGHAVIEWAWEPGHDDAMAALLGGSTVFYDFYVVDSFRSQGIGSQMLNDVDRLAQEHRSPLIGLGVAIDNPRARSLYERHGYEDAGIGEYLTGWVSLDAQGQQHWVEEWETCMIKRFA